MFRLYAITLAVCAALTFAACSGDTEESVESASPSSAPASLLHHVPLSQIDGTMRSDKFELPPVGASPAITEAAARSEVAQQVPGSEIEEMVLLQSDDLLKTPPYAPNLVWIGNLVPATYTSFDAGPECYVETCPARGPAVTDWTYVIVDATTGEWLHTATAASYETFTPAP